MKTKKRKSGLTVVFVVFSLSTFLSHASKPAAISSDEGFFIGEKIGWTKHNKPCTEVDRCNLDTVGYSIFAGYDFNRWFALEGGISNYGNPSYFEGNIKSKSADIWGIDLSTRFKILDLSDSISLYSKIGSAIQHSKYLYSSSSKSASNWGLLGAIGMDYQITNQWALQAEYTRVDFKREKEFISDNDLMFASIGLTYNFGRSNVSSIQDDNKIHEPKVEVRTIEAELVKELLYVNFPNDSSELVNAGATLKNLMDELKDSQGSITLVGYTDSVGSENYNQRLSYRRAKSVADYLIKEGILSERIQIFGKGEADPIGDNSTVTGRQKNRRTEITYNKLITKY